MTAEPNPRPLTDYELSPHMQFNHDVAVRAVWLAFERVPDPLQAAARQVRAEWLAKGRSVPC